MTIRTEIANIASDSGQAGLAQLKTLLEGLSASDRNAGALACSAPYKNAKKFVFSTFPNDTSFEGYCCLKNSIMSHDRLGV